MQPLCSFSSSTVLQHLNLCLSVTPGLLSFISGSRDSSPIPFQGSVKRELLEEVLGGDKYSVNNLLDDKYRPRPVEEIVRLAESLVGEVSFYNVLLSNCEHFATNLRYGKRKSNQVRSRVMGFGRPLGVVFTEGGAAVSKHLSCLDIRTGCGSSVPH